jgi:hypothetical protein
MNTHICHYTLFDSKNHPIATGNVPIEVTRTNPNYELLQKELLEILFKVVIVQIEEIK